MIAAKSKLEDPGIGPRSSMPRALYHFSIPRRRKLKPTGCLTDTPKTLDAKFGNDCCKIKTGRSRYRSRYFSHAKRVALPLELIPRRHKLKHIGCLTDTLKTLDAKFENDCCSKVEDPGSVPVPRSCKSSALPGSANPPTTKITSYRLFDTPKTLAIRKWLLQNQN